MPSPAAKDLVDDVDRPADVSARAVASLQAIDAAWRAVFARIHPAPLPDRAAQLLGEKRYVEAANEVRIALAPAADALDVVKALRRRAAGPPLVVSDEMRSEVMKFRTVTPPLRTLPMLRAFRTQTLRSIVATKVWQSVLVAGLAGVIAWGVFEPKFIGDYQDFVLIFFWAFRLDLAVDAVAKLAPTTRR